MQGNKRKHFGVLDEKGDAAGAINFIGVTAARALSRLKIQDPREESLLR